MRKINKLRYRIEELEVYTTYLEDCITDIQAVVFPDMCPCCNKPIDENHGTDPEVIQFKLANGYPTGTKEPTEHISSGEYVISKKATDRIKQESGTKEPE